MESFAKRLTAHQIATTTKGKTTDTPVQTASLEVGNDVAQQFGGDRGNGSQSASSQTEEGLVQEATCTASAITNVRFAILGKTLLLAAVDSSKISLRLAGTASTLSAIPCEQWKGRKARIVFTPSPDEKSPAEIISVDFL